MEGARIEVWEGRKCLLSVEGWTVPRGAILRECYETEKEIIVCGWPRQDDEDHNCELMGCSSLGHVLYRISKKDLC